MGYGLCWAIVTGKLRVTVGLVDFNMVVEDCSSLKHLRWRESVLEANLFNSLVIEFLNSYACSFLQSSCLLIIHRLLERLYCERDG
jgi:hypothetical protein